jgi:hypothetical protein
VFVCVCVPPADGTHYGGGRQVLTYHIYDCVTSHLPVAVWLSTSWRRSLSHLWSLLVTLCACHTTARLLGQGGEGSCCVCLFVCKRESVSLRMCCAVASTVLR